jgi:hypothetical protein
MTNASAQAVTTPLDKRLCLSAFIASFSILFMEVVYFQQMTFLTSYMAANLVISIALLGIAAGGILAFLLARWALPLVPISLIALGPLSLLAFGHALLQPDAYLVNAIVMTLPFLVGSFVISLTFAAERRTNLIYAFDLSGAGAGALAAALLVPLLREEGSAIFLAAMLTALTPLFLAKALGKRLRVVLLVLGATLLAGSATMLGFHVAMDSFNMIFITSAPKDPALRTKIYNTTRRGSLEHGEVFSAGSLIERTDVFWERKGNYMVAYNGRVNDHTSNRSEYMYAADRRIPIPLFKKRIPHPDCLVIGTSIEGVCKLCKYIAGDHGTVTGLEYKACVLDVVMDNDERIHRHGRYWYEGVDTVIEDARTYLGRTDKKFDVITMMNTHRVRTIGAEGPPEFLHTVDAVHAYMDHLSDKGAVVIEERVLNAESEAGLHRAMATIGAALRERGLNPAHHVILYEYYVQKIRRSDFTRIGVTATKDGYSINRYAFIVLFKSPANRDEEVRTVWNRWKSRMDTLSFTRAGCSDKKDHCSKELVRSCVKNNAHQYRDYDKAVDCVVESFDQSECKCRHKMGLFSIRERHTPWGSIGHTMSLALTSEDPRGLLKGQGYNVSAATDDKPFITDVDAKQPMLDEMLVIVASAAAIIVLPPLLILAIVMMLQERRRRKSAPTDTAETRPRHLIVFGLFSGIVGVSFLLIEVVLIQWFSIFMGSPAASLAIILPGMLILSGVGGAISSKLTERGALMALVGIVLLVLIFRFFMGDALVSLIGLPIAARVLLMLVSLAPLFIAMGIPFSFALKKARAALSPVYPALFFGINGALGALSTPLAIKLSMTVGFKSTLLIGTGLYAVTAALLALSWLLDRRQATSDTEQSSNDARDITPEKVVA